jgi:ferredoxin
LTGYPATRSGIEIKILKRLFSEQEAELFMQLSPMPERPLEIAKRISRNAEDVAQDLGKMAQKGLLYRVRKADSVTYSTPPFVPGILEFQVNTIDQTLALNIEDYYQEALGRGIQGNATPIMRTIPINTQMNATWPIVAPYDDAIEILNKQKSIKVSHCICRLWGRLVQRGCNKPLETCFHFGSMADYYVENRMGRYVDAAEAKDIIRKNLEEAPLVIQVANAQKGGAMCMCCGDCCEMLRSSKMQSKPAESVRSNYYVKVNGATCKGCKTCVKRCQMDAIDAVDEKSIVNYDRCIGCGNCVVTCSSKSLELVKKPEDQRYVPPDNLMMTYMEIVTQRGKM